MRLGGLFSGYGGLESAVHQVFDCETAWLCEFDDAPSQVLEANYPGVPNLGDITAVDWSRVEPVDILCGGFPCQDLSLAGRRAGMRPGTRSGLWADFKKAISALQPSIVVIENVRGLLSGCAESDLEPCPGCLGDGEHRPVLRALGRVLADLADLGFDAEWGGFRASDVGAPHGRYRVFIVAYRPGTANTERELVESGSSRPGGASVDDRGRSGVPVGLPAGAFMFSTPDTMPDAPNANSNRVKQPGGLQDQVLSLLPTPVAQPSGNSPEDHLRKKPGREVVTDLAIMAENGLFETGGRLLPTPKAGDAEMGLPRTSGRPPEKSTHLATRLHYDTDGVSWGPYEPAVRRWEALTRQAPSPTKPDGKNGRLRLSSSFVEWLMGLPEGHVTGHGLSRKDELKMLGNGVVPQQAAEAIRQLWVRAQAHVRQEVAA